MSLTIRNLSAGYRARLVFRDLDLEPLPRGSVAVIVGPNGSGKSTLFRCISGFVQPCRGTIGLDGKDLRALPRKVVAEKVFYMTQAYSLNLALSVFETVLLAHRKIGSWRASPRKISAVERILDELGLADVAQCNVSEISGGQQQLVSMAQALIRKPDVLLLDEPTSALDLRHQLEVIRLVRRVTERCGTVTLIGSHDLNLAARIADEMLVLNHGKIVARGAPEQVLSSCTLSEIYGVGIQVERSSRNSLLIQAYLSGT